MQCPQCQAEIPTPTARMSYGCSNGCGWAVSADAEGRLTLLPVEPSPTAAEPDYIALASLSVLTLLPGDTIVITDPEQRTRNERLMLTEDWRVRFPGHRVLYLDGGREIGVLRREGEGGRNP